MTTLAFKLLAGAIALAVVACATAQERPTQASTGFHATQTPAATHFAALTDVDAIPKLSASDKALYREWLTKPFPRAVAISDSGALAPGYGPYAMQQAVQDCERQFGNPCRLYAVDDQVVWKPR